MSISIVASRSELLAGARAEWNREAALKPTVKGQKADSLPPDSVLIATDPTLSNQIRAADAGIVISGGASSTAAGLAGIAGAGSSASDKTGSASSGAANEASSGSSAQSGQALNVLA